MIRGDYAWAMDFTEGPAPVLVPAAGDTPGTMSAWGFIDKTGHFVIGPQAGSLLMRGNNPGQFADDLACAPAGDKRGFIAKSGKLVIPFQYAWASSFDGGLAAVADDKGLLSYIDETGKYVWRETIVVPLSAEKREQLDSLDALDVLRTYFETSDPWVVYYLSSPREQDMLTAFNAVGWEPHPGVIANLTFDGPNNVSTDPGEYSPEDWPVQEQFDVEYDLLVARPDFGEEAGPQIRFAYVGKQSADSPWRVLGVGTGP